MEHQPARRAQRQKTKASTVQSRHRVISCIYVAQDSYMDRVLTCPLGHISGAISRCYKPDRVRRMTVIHNDRVG